MDLEKISIAKHVNSTNMPRRHGSISAVIFEYTISTICKMWSNKNNTHQLKILIKQLKVNSAIAFQTKLNASYLILVTKHSHISHTNQIRRCHRFATTTQPQPKAKKRVDKEDEISLKGINKSNHIYILTHIYFGFGSI